LVLGGGEWSALHPGCFTSREGACSTHWVGGWVGPRAGLDAVVKRKLLVIEPLSSFLNLLTVLTCVC